MRGMHRLVVELIRHGRGGDIYDCMEKVFHDGADAITAYRFYSRYADGAIFGPVRLYGPDCKLMMES